MVSIISRVDTAHREMIHDAQMNYYGTRLATCSSDRLIKIFDVKPNGQSFPIAELTGHEGPVWQVTWAHPKFESVLASCSYDRKVIIWKEQQGGKWNRFYEYNQHDASINSISWAPHQFGLILACASTDNNISIISYQASDHSWDARKILKAHEQGCNAVSWCPATDGGSLVDQSHNAVVKRLVSGGNDKRVKIWKEEQDGSWKVEHSFEGHLDWVRDVAWAPAVGFPASTIASCGQDKRVLIWRCSNLDQGKWESKLLATFDDVVWHVSWSLCGTILAVSGGDNKVSLWKENLEGEWACISDSEKDDNRSEG
uniref:Protein SEC13 homolog n=1 Tax=Plectus sambesii TaxID=2011161 RepID=A0A914W122_9BILA